MLLAVPQSVFVQTHTFCPWKPPLPWHCHFLHTETGDGCLGLSSKGFLHLWSSWESTSPAPPPSAREEVSEGCTELYRKVLD